MVGKLDITDCINIEWIYTECKACFFLQLWQMINYLLTTPVVSRVAELEVLGGVRFLTTLGAGVRFFCPTPGVELDHFLYHTPKLGIPIEMVQFVWNFVETDFLLCTTISTNFNSQISLPLC